MYGIIIQNYSGLKNKKEGVFPLLFFIKKNISTVFFNYILIYDFRVGGSTPLASFGLSSLGGENARIRIINYSYIFFYLILLFIYILNRV